MLYNTTLNKGQKGFDTSVEEDMYYHDLLPSQLRDLLNYLPTMIAAKQVWEFKQEFEAEGIDAIAAFIQLSKVHPDFCGDPLSGTTSQEPPNDRHEALRRNRTALTRRDEARFARWLEQLGDSARGPVGRARRAKR